jgi:hypothetical protein
LVVHVFFRLGIVVPVAAALVKPARSEEAIRRTNKKTAVQGAGRHLAISGVAVWSLIGPRGTVSLGGAALEIYQYKVCANT